MVTVVVHQGLKPRSGAQHLLEVHSQQWVVTSRRQTDQNVASQCAANHHLTPPCWSLSPHPGNIYHLRLTRAQNRTEQTDHVTPGVLVHTCRTDLLTRRDSSLTPFLFNYICRTKTLNLIPVQSGFGISDLYLFTLRCLEFNYFYC